MKLNKSLFIAALIFPFALMAQEENDSVVAPPSKPKLERPAFESTSLIDSQSNILNPKGTLQMDMNHRFGLVNGTNDMIGIWAPANIRIALNYAISNRINIGYGTTKDKRLQDFNLKVALLRQTRNNDMPFSVTYYGNMAVDARTKDNFINTSDRWSFFNQLIMAKRLNDKVSFQIAPSFSHYNYVETPVKNDMFSLEVGGRLKLSSTAAILVESNLPISSFRGGSLPQAGLGLGVEFSTGAHAFQIFITNYKGIVSQQNNVYNQNEFMNGEFLIGFNISRLWDM